MRQALHHRQILPSLMILMFLFIQRLVDLLINHNIRQIRQITLEFHQDYLQLHHVLVAKEQERWANRVNDRVHDQHH